MLTGAPVDTGATPCTLLFHMRASGNQHTTSCRKMLTIKIATDVGAHGEGAKIGTMIFPGEIQKHHHSSVLGVSSYRTRFSPFEL